MADGMTARSAKPNAANNAVGDDSVTHQALIEEGRRLRAESQQLIAQAKQTCAHVAWLVEDIKRRWQRGFHRPLQDAIRAIHQCESTHVASFAVRKVAGGQMIWEGTVEEFALCDHPEAERCYAWHYLKDGRKESFSLLKLPPVDSPQRAVQLALAAYELGNTVEAT